MAMNALQKHDVELQFRAFRKMSQSIQLDGIGPDAATSSERLENLLALSRSLRQFSAQIRDYSETVRLQAYASREELRSRHPARVDPSL